jgi:hypothetical protein
MLGTFSPQPEPYTYVTPEDTTPSGMFARGSYSARTKVRTYLDAEQNESAQASRSDRLHVRRYWDGVRYAVKYLVQRPTLS